MGDRVNVRAYGEKVATSVVGQLRPKWQEAVGQGQRAGGGQEGRTRGKGGRGRPEQAAAADCGCAAPSERGDRKVLASIVADVSRKIQADRAAKIRQRDQERQAARSNRDQDRGYSR